MNEFLTFFLTLIVLIVLLWLSDKYTRYINAGKENDDDLDLFH